MRPLASRMSVMSGEGALSIFARAKELERSGRSIIHLELGEPDFHPVKPVNDALKRAIDEGKDRYCPVGNRTDLDTPKICVGHRRACKVGRCLHAVVFTDLGAEKFGTGECNGNRIS